MTFDLGEMLRTMEKVKQQTDNLNHEIEALIIGDIETLPENEYLSFSTSSAQPPKPSASHLADKTRSEHNETMTDISRQELDAKLEAVEARMDARVATIASKIDLFLAKSENSEQVLRLISQQAVDASVSAAASAERAGGIKSSLWITSITTILSVLGIALAAYFGTQQSNLGIVQTTISAFESGRNAGPPIVTPQTPPPPSR
jgi:hypothetical protein